MEVIRATWLRSMKIQKVLKHRYVTMTRNGRCFQMANEEHLRILKS
jgi:hypothetical protein